eukprot:g11879.t1
MTMSSKNWDALDAEDDAREHAFQAGEELLERLKTQQQEPTSPLGRHQFSSQARLQQQQRKNQEELGRTIRGMQTVIDEQFSGKLNCLEPHEASVFLELRLHQVAVFLSSSSSSGVVSSFRDIGEQTAEGATLYRVAAESLDQVLQFDPCNAHAHWFKGLCLYKVVEKEKEKLAKTRTNAEGKEEENNEEAPAEEPADKQHGHLELLRKSWKAAIDNLKKGVDCAARMKLPEADVWAGQLRAYQEQQTRELQEAMASAGSSGNPSTSVSVPSVNSTTGNANISSTEEPPFVEELDSDEDLENTFVSTAAKNKPKDNNNDAEQEARKSTNAKSNRCTGLKKGFLTSSSKTTAAGEGVGSGVSSPATPATPELVEGANQDEDPAVFLGDSAEQFHQKLDDVHASLLNNLRCLEQGMQGLLTAVHNLGTSSHHTNVVKMMNMAQEEQLQRVQEEQEELREEQKVLKEGHQLQMQNLEKMVARVVVGPLVEQMNKLKELVHEEHKAGTSALVVDEAKKPHDGRSTMAVPDAALGRYAMAFLFGMLTAVVMMREAYSGLGCRMTCG